MIESTANPKIRFAQAVRAGRHRELLLVEGERGIVEAAEAGLHFRLLLATQPVAPVLSELLPDTVPRPLITDVKLLASVSDLDAPRDAIGVVELQRPMASDFLPGDLRRLLVYADRVQDPVNLGALARVSAAVGADALLTSPGCAHANHHRAVRASAFSLLKLPVYPDFDWDRVRNLSSRAASIVALDGRAATPIYDYSIRTPAVVIIGGEMGIDPERLSEVDSAAIPMRGEVESLNLAVAAGIALFEWRRHLK